MTGSHIRKEFKGAAKPATLQAGINSSATSMTITTYVGWPDGSTGPFVVCLDRGTSLEEKVLCTSRVNGAITIQTRGYDDTTAVAHSTTEGGVEHVIDASTLDQANRFVNLQSAKGDVVAHDGSNPQKLTVGTNSHVLTADSTATNGVAWAQVATAGIADDAITADKIATGAVGADALAATTVTAGNYGDADSVGSFTVDADGRLTAASNVNISIASSAVSDATNANTASKIVKRDASGDFSAGTITANLTGNVTGNLTGNASTATTLATSRNFSITGDITASSVSFNGNGNVQLTASIDANTVGSSELANGAVGATQMATGIRIKTGVGTAGSDYSDNGYGYYTIAHGCGTTPTFAAVSCTAKQSSGSDTIASCVVVEITSTNIVFRLYEIDGASITNNGGATVSSVYSATTPVKWMALY